MPPTPSCVLLLSQSHPRHLLVSLHHCPMTPQRSPRHSSRSLRSLHSSLCSHTLRNRLRPFFGLFNRRLPLFLCPNHLLFRRASFLVLLNRLIYSLPQQLIRNVLLLLIKLLLPRRFLRILALQILSLMSSKIQSLSVSVSKIIPWIVFALLMTFSGA